MEVCDVIDVEAGSRDGRAGVIGIDDAVIISVIAGVAEWVFGSDGIGLGWVRGGGAVVVCVCYAVIIVIGVAGIAEAVVINVALHGVGSEGAIIRGPVADAVIIVIRVDEIVLGVVVVVGSGGAGELIGGEVNDALDVFSIHGEGVEGSIGQVADDVLRCGVLCGAFYLSVLWAGDDALPADEKTGSIYLIVPDQCHLPALRDAEDRIGDVEGSGAARGGVLARSSDDAPRGIPEFDGDAIGACR